jgi:hypothetical protein
MRSAHVVASVSSSTIRALNHAPETSRLARPPAHGAARHWGCRELRAIAGEIGRAYARVLLRVDCAPEHGDELLSQVDIFAAEPEGRVIRGDLMPFVDDLRIRRGDVLMAGAGQMGEATLFGRSIIADDRLAGRLAAGDVMIVRFEAPDSSLSLYTYAFLTSRSGLSAIRACAYGTSIPRIRPDLLARLPVPVPDEGTQSRVARLVRKAMDDREIYLRELQAGRRIIEELPEMREGRAMCAERKARWTIWSRELPSICAWNYASTGGALETLLRRWNGRVHDVVPVAGIFRGGRCQRIACEPPYGIEFLSQRDVFSVRPIPRRILLPPLDRSLVFVEAGTLLVGGQGTLGEGEIFGRVAFTTPDIASLGVTEHLLRIQPSDPAQAAVAYAFLSTLVGRRLLRATGVGTKLLSLRPDLILRLPFPDLPPATSQRVAKHLRHASVARVSGAKAEAEAIRIVEEEVIPAWLA